MAKSVEEQVLDKRTKEEIRQQLLEVVNTKVKDEIVEIVAQDVRNTFDEETKEEIKKEISDELVIDIKEEINKEQRKLTRRKSFKIFRLEVYILLLIAIVGFLVYKLYINGGLEFLNKYKIVPNNEVTTTTTAVVNKDFNYYLNNYGYLVDTLKITNIELLKGNYNLDNVDVTDKLAMAYLSVSDENIIKEGIIYTLTEENLTNAYKSIFGTLDTYKANNFSVNGMSYAYQESTKSYIAVVTGNVSNGNTLVYDISQITEVGGNLVFTTTVGLVKDNKLYNIFDLVNPVEDYTEIGIKNSLDKYSKVEFTFKNIEGKYYISNISKK